MHSISQLSDRYEKKEWEELIGNCDIQICLGCNDQMTAKYISDKCGVATMMPDEILRMDNRRCLVLLRGQQPLRLYKIIPDEFPVFRQLRSTPVREHVPDWRKEAE